VKQTVGEAVGNDQVANEGAAQQVKGHAEQAWGTIKSVVTDKVDEIKANHEAATEQRAAEHEAKAHDIRESVTSTAQNVKEHIQQDADNTRSSH
jgi:uncharacterized protein YjbJ (UPF0337 family)